MSARWGIEDVCVAAAVGVAAGATLVLALVGSVGPQASDDEQARAAHGRDWSESEEETQARWARQGCHTDTDCEAWGEAQHDAIRFKVIQP